MGNITLDAYIFFDGDCRAAMEFYKGVFGGELDLRTYADMPGSDEANKDKIMHAVLKSDDLHFMASDGREGQVSRGSKIELTLSGDDAARLQKIFEGLSEGGKVKYKLEKQFWGDTFGTLTDKYGIDWQVNISAQKP